MATLEYEIITGDGRTFKKTEYFMTGIGVWMRKQTLKHYKDAIVILNDDEEV